MIRLVTDGNLEVRREALEECIRWAPPPSRLHDFEDALITALAGAAPKISGALEARDFNGAIAAAAELRAPVDRFFDEVLVMAEDAQVRANRLRLLLDVRDAVGALGDLSQIPR